MNRDIVGTSCVTVLIVVVGAIAHKAVRPSPVHMLDRRRRFLTQKGSERWGSISPVGDGKVEASNAAGQEDIDVVKGRRFVIICSQWEW